MKAFNPIRLKRWSPRRRRRVRFVCLLLLLAPATLLAQNLRISSATAVRGEMVALEISLDSAPGKEPVALQWDVTIPAGQLSFVEHDPPAGPAARAADKSMACVVKLLKLKDADKFTLVCIVAGGLKPIPNGLVALLRLQVSPEARVESQQVYLRGFAVDKDAGETPFKEVETAVTVHAK